MIQVLVTGAAGNLGRSLVVALTAKGYRVRAVDCVEGPSSPGVEWARCDVTDLESLRTTMVGCEAVIHLAALGLPWLASEEEVFRVNDYGSFCVFCAAAKSGIRRIVTASSINAVGMYFGMRRLTVDRIPMTEESRCVASDIYSFSKQLQESIAEYFYRRSGITSVSLRMGGDMRIDPQPAAPAIRETVVQLLDRPRDEGRRHAREMVERFFARSSDLRWRYNEEYLANAIATGVTHLWTALDCRDRDEAFALALEANSEGAEVINVADAHNTLGIDARELASLFYPEAEVDVNLRGTQSLWSIERARTLLGFVPKYSVARYFSG
jgi:nucleoside-diphosphate-sugar epimerase